MKIALLGSAPSSCKLAPWNDPSWEIWACSPQNYSAPRVDAWFELHNLERKWVPGNEVYVNTIQKHARVYIAQPDARLPNGIVYPKDKVYEFFGNYQFLDTFFQSQVSFMLAFAIMQNPETIGCWGIDMAAADEYGQQRPGCHYFFTEAEKRGIEIVAPPQSDILEPLPLYAYKEFLPKYWRTKARILELKQAVNECDAKIQALEQEKLVKTGALQDIEYHKNTYMR